MTLEDLANLAEIIGVAAVLASLIFVGIQIRQNNVQARDANQLARAQMHQQIADGFTQMMSLAIQAEDKLIEAIFDDGFGGNLSRADAQKFSVIMLALWKHLENVFYQHKEGFVADAYWQSTCNYMSLLLMRKGVAQWWERRKAVFAPEFTSFVDQLGNPHLLKEMDAEWQSFTSQTKSTEARA